MTSMVLRNSTLESLTPSVNASLVLKKQKNVLYELDFMEVIS
jgi:hypothetical protein